MQVRTHLTAAAMLVPVLAPDNGDAAQGSLRKDEPVAATRRESRLQ
jgi:hypothetical protein